MSSHVNCIILEKRSHSDGKSLTSRVYILDMASLLRDLWQVYFTDKYKDVTSLPSSLRLHSFLVIFSAFAPGGKRLGDRKSVV